MASTIIMPKQGLQMTEGTIIKWLKKEGELVKEGEPLFEMETDKLTITMDSTATGTLLKIVKGEGEVVPITEVIAYVGEPGEAIPGAEAPAAAPVEAAPAAPAVDPSSINASIVIMPKQGLQMTEGTIIKWLKKEGETVKEGEPLFEMETDKLTITMDSTATGTVLKLIRAEGEVVPITEPIAVIGEPGTDIGPLLGEAPAAPAAAPVEAAPAVDLSSIKASVIIMPKQGLQMTEGTIIKWLKKEGETVKEGEPLFEMETDKLTITMDSTATGTVLKIVRGEGEVVPITEPIAVVGEPGTDYAPLLGTAPAAPAAAPAAAPVAAVATNSTALAVKRAPGEKVFATPRAKWRAEEKGIAIELVAGTGPDGLIIERDVLNTDVTAVKATPVAKKIAELNGVDLSTVTGTGANGKIMKGDVLGTNAPAEEVAAPVATAAPVVAAEHKETIVPFTGMRKAIANNMMKSLETMAQANHRMKVDMSESVRFRSKLKAADIKVSYTDILVKAVAHALIKYPAMNACVDGNNIIQKHYVNMGIAVAIENGLIVPNIKDAHLKSVVEIHDEVASLAKKAREGKLTRDEYTSGTFTITNLGMYDIDDFTPVINPPEVGILGVGTIKDTPVVEKGEIVVRPIMTLSLTYDHRVIDGAPAAEFLQYIKTLLQNPYLMM